MRGDVLQRHMKRHERKNEDNVVTNGQGTTLGNGKSGNDEELEKRVIAQMNEFERKMELGRKVKVIVNKHNFNVNGLEKDMKDALETYKLYGETKEDMYKCKFCSYISKGKYNVKRHEKEIHYYDE